MKDRRLAFPVHAARMVVVHRPPAIGDEVVETSLSAYVVLRQDVIAHVAAAFALARQETHPFQHPVLGSVITAILDVIPDTEGHLEQVVADDLRIVDGILLTAQLDPPEVRARIFDGVRTKGQIRVGRVDVGPRRRDKRLRTVGLASLDQAAHPHRLVVRLLRFDVLVEFGARLAAHADLCPSQRGEDAVAGAVSEEVRLDGMPRLGRRLPTLDGRDPVAVHRRIGAGAVQQQVNIRLEAHFLVQDAVPDEEVAQWIAVAALQRDLFDKAGLTVVVAVRAAHPHPHLG